MVKLFLTSLKIVLISIIITFLGLSFWLLNPLDKQAWRMQFSIPYLGKLSLRAYPLFVLATSLPGRRLLNDSNWQSNHGAVFFNDHTDSINITCVKCTFSVAELSAQPITLDRIHLTVRDNQYQQSGSIKVSSAEHDVHISYVGQINMQGVQLKWSLPRTALVSLLAPLQMHSDVLQKAHITGSLAATGTLQWPNRSWSINPDLQGFEVTGLGTEKLKYGTLKYRCHATQTTNIPQTYTWVTEKNMGRWLPKAVLIAEDAHFMQHPGYDLEIIRNLVGSEYRNKTLRRKILGGSTITQQLAKNFFTGGKRNWIRKLEELLYAVEMEHSLGKRRMLALYLNTVDWGPNICGANQAAKVYFGLTPSQLSPVQAAWLAGILRNPHRAWQQEYLPNDPNMERLSWMMRYMPKKVHPPSLTLKFIRFETMSEE